jgi:hypothetical protein
VHSITSFRPEAGFLASHRSVPDPSSSTEARGGSGGRRGRERQAGSGSAAARRGAGGKGGGGTRADRALGPQVGSPVRPCERWMGGGSVPCPAPAGPADAGRDRAAHPHPEGAVHLDQDLHRRGRAQSRGGRLRPALQPPVADRAPRAQAHGDDPASRWAVAGTSENALRNGRPRGSGAVLDATLEQAASISRRADARPAPCPCQYAVRFRVPQAARTIAARPGRSRPSLSTTSSGRITPRSSPTTHDQDAPTQPGGRGARENALPGVAWAPVRAPPPTRARLVPTANRTQRPIAAMTREDAARWAFDGWAGAGARSRERFDVTSHRERLSTSGRSGRGRWVHPAPSHPLPRSATSSPFRQTRSRT